MRTLLLLALFLSCPSLALAQSPTPESVLRLRGLGEVELQRQTRAVDEELTGASVLIGFGGAGLVAGLGMFFGALSCDGTLVNLAPYSGGSAFRCNNDDRLLYGGLVLSALGVTALISSIFHLTSVLRRGRRLSRALEGMGSIDVSISPTGAALMIRHAF